MYGRLYRFDFPCEGGQAQTIHGWLVSSQKSFSERENSKPRLAASRLYLLYKALKLAVYPSRLRSHSLEVGSGHSGSAYPSIVGPGITAERTQTDRRSLFTTTLLPANGVVAC